MSNTWPENRAVNFGYSYLIGYLEDTRIMESMIGMTGLSFDFKSMSVPAKNGYLRRYSNHKHRTKPDEPLQDIFYSSYNKNYIVLAHVIDSTVIRYTNKVKRLLVSKFYHDRKNKNFLKNLKYVSEKDKIDEIDFSEINESSRKLYEYNKDPKHTSNLAITTKTMDWPFPEIGYTVHRFIFAFPKVKTWIDSIINPKNDLINVENGIEEAINRFNSEHFFSSKINIEDKIAEYNAVPTKNFINETYFLYDKSFFVKKTFLIAINKTLSIYGSFSHFSGKTTEKEIQLLEASNFSLKNKH